MVVPLLNRACVPLESSHRESTEPSTSWGLAESQTAGYSEEEEGGREGEGTQTSNQGQEQVVRLSCRCYPISLSLSFLSSQRDLTQTVQLLVRRCTSVRVEAMKSTQQPSVLLPLGLLTPVTVRCCGNVLCLQVISSYL